MLLANWFAMNNRLGSLTTFFTSSRQNSMSMGQGSGKESAGWAAGKVALRCSLGLDFADFAHFAKVKIVGGIV